MQRIFAVCCGSLGSLVLLLAAPGAAEAAPFSNGSFETPVVGSTADRIDVTAGSFLTGTSGWQAINTPTNNSNIAIYSNTGKNTWPVPSDGHQLSTLNSINGTGKGGIQQSFDTIPGQLYSMTFDYSAISDATARTNVRATYEIDDGAPLATATTSPLASGTATTNTPASNLAFPAYIHYSLSFVALSATSTVRFTSLQVTGGNAFGPVVDNVAVTPTPEPGTLTLAIAPLAALLLRRRRSAH